MQCIYRANEEHLLPVIPSERSESRDKARLPSLYFERDTSRGIYLPSKKITSSSQTPQDSSSQAAY
ncbi:MAG: hypothetical protein ACI9XB_002827 [Gammaproteobacteria bacterium]|jgi:hypothetical protein